MKLAIRSTASSYLHQGNEKLCAPALQNQFRCNLRPARNCRSIRPLSLWKNDQNMSDKGPQALNVSKDPGAPGSDGSAPVIGQAASPSPAPPHPPPPTWTEIPVRLGAYQQPAPVPGIPLAPPLVTPQTGQVVVAWEVFKPNPGCCQCNGLSTAGWVSIVLLIIFFTPLAWSKFLYTSCHYTRLLY